MGKIRQSLSDLYRELLSQRSNPLQSTPLASPQVYRELYAEATKAKFPDVDAFEERLGYAIEAEWLGKLAFHTQVVLKKSDLNWQHGRLIYALVRDYIAKNSEGGKASESLVIFETGTARGFSALCMSKALTDSKTPGMVFSVDTLPHDRAIFWNCIDDHDGRKTRAQLLSRWPNEVARVVFLEGISAKVLSRTSLSRIHFAFLDAGHNEQAVLGEYRYVSSRQRVGDLIFFDDVTPGSFDGVAEAVRDIESEGAYSVSYFRASDHRGYALAVKRQ